MKKVKKGKLPKMLAKDFDFNVETDFTLEDIRLMSDPHEQPHEIENARTAFKKMTGQVPDSRTAEGILDDLVKEGTFTKFTVNMGWKTETVWRKL